MGSADVPEKDKKSVGSFSGPIHSIEPEDESRHDPDLTVEAVEPHKEASDALKESEEIHSTNQGPPESCGRLRSTPLKRSLATPVPDSDVRQETKRTKRASNWTTQETGALIICKLQLPLPKGNAGWELISSQIPGRSTQQCRQRWDTLKKPYKKMKDYCVAHGKELSQVSKEEFLSMKLDLTLFTNGHWYKMIDDYSSRPTISSSGTWKIYTSPAFSVVSNG